MQTTVLFRNIHANEEFEAAKKAFDAAYKNGDTDKLSDRPIHQGLQASIVEATTVQDIQKAVKEALSAHLVNQDYTLTTDNICVIEKRGETMRRMVEDDLVMEDATYYALEVFSILPFDVFKAVPMNEISPCTFSNTSNEGRKYTKFAPVFLGTIDSPHKVMGKEWFTALPSGEVNVRGVSVTSRHVSNLFGKDLSVPWTDDAIKTYIDGENPYTMPLETFTALVEHNDPNSDFKTMPELGILESCIYHRKQKSLLSTEVPSQLMGKKQLRSLNFCLPKGTNLAELGFSLVYDNLGFDGHFSLVPTSKPVQDAVRKIPSFYFIQEHTNWNPNNYTDEQISSLMTSTTELGQPLVTSHSWTGYPFFPLLASKFFPTEVLINRRSEPSSSTFYDDFNQKILCKGMELLFENEEWPLSNDIVMAHQMLKDVDYKADLIHPSLCCILKDAICKLESSFDSNKPGYGDLTKLTWNAELILQGHQYSEDDEDGDGYDWETWLYE